MGAGVIGAVLFGLVVGRAVLQRLVYLFCVIYFFYRGLVLICRQGYFSCLRCCFLNFARFFRAYFCFRRHLV